MSHPTIKDVANKSGVGIATVSRVLNNSSQISPQTYEKVMKVIKELNYVPNATGKKLSQNRTHVIAVIVPVINHPYFAKLIEEIELAADARGYSILVASSQHRIEREREILKRIAQNEADGAIFVTHYEHKEEEFKGLAIVSIDRHLGKDIPIVTTDNYDATKKAVEYLINTGCKKIAFLGTKPSQASEVSLRAKAYLDTLKEHNLEPFVINKIVSHGNENEVIDEFLNKRHDFDGVYVSGCILANTLRNRLEELDDIEIPNDLQIISYDGDFCLNNYSPTTTLEQPIKDMANKCVELLIQLIDEEKIENMINSFNCRFVKGKTTK